MSADSVVNEHTKSALADVTDDSCRLSFIEIVPLTQDTDGPHTTECDSGDWSAQVKQENLPVVKQEPQDVCFVDFISFYATLLSIYVSVSWKEHIMTLTDLKPLK